MIEFAKYCVSHLSMLIEDKHRRKKNNAALDPKRMGVRHRHNVNSIEEKVRHR